MAAFSRERLDQTNDNRLYHVLGLRLLQIENGDAQSVLEPTEDLCWPFEGQPHGGVLFTQMDTTMATAVMTAGEVVAANCATISMDIQYTRPARGRRFTCEVWTTHATGRTGFARGEIRDEKGEIVAIAQGTFRLIQPKSV